jgi:WD40 repeat protein
MNRHLIALCAVLAAVSVLTPSAGASRPSGWSEPANLGSMINTEFDENGPAISRNGLTLYFQSNRPGGPVPTVPSNCDIWVAHRHSVHDEWDWPENLGPVINTGSCENSVALSRDEHHLFFGRPRPGGTADVWASYRKDVRDDFAWQAPVPLGPAINTDNAAESTPRHFENRKLGLSQLYFYRNPGVVGSFDIYVAHAFGAAKSVSELNSPRIDAGAALSRNGLEVFFHSDRDGGVGARDLWTSVRASVFDPWSPPVNLGGIVNSPFNDLVPAISPDGETLFFTSDRPNGFGLADLYMTTRSRHGRR